MIDIRHGDCIDAMRAMDDACVDAIVTDPPYELGFMGRSWDSTGIANSVEMWREAFRVLKPGGHLLAFSGTRTYHRMVCAIEDAGFEVRDQIGWVYGSGFPKSLDVSKAIDKAAGAEREVIGPRVYADGTTGHYAPVAEGWDRPSSQAKVAAGSAKMDTAPATPEAQQWAGWGTALKPAWESICVARKPLSEKTVAANVLAHGTGAINIDACRVGIAADDDIHGKNPHTKNYATGWAISKRHDDVEAYDPGKGRWPANLITDGSDEVLEAFAAFGSSNPGKARDAMTPTTHEGVAKFGHNPVRHQFSFGDHGTAARFFYSAKASAKDRAGSKHPTVKPISLMRYLVKLITPPGGTVLDMFAGSGSTGQAALEEGFNAILIEQDATYVNDIRSRISAAREGLGLFAVAAE